MCSSDLVQTDATTSNIVGSCSGGYWMFLAVVCKRTQLLPPLLGVVPADVRCCWQWCENGCNNFGISSPSWARKLAIFVRISATGKCSVSLASLSFFFGVGAWWCYFLLKFIKKYFLLRHYKSNKNRTHTRCALCISMETICKTRA